MRFSNRTEQKILYLASSNGSIIPECYEAFRAVWEKQWKYFPGYARASSDFRNSEYAWLELPARAVIEFEIEDYRDRSEEHAFSIFIKLGPDKKPVELMSNVIRPVKIK